MVEGTLGRGRVISHGRIGLEVVAWSRWGEVGFRGVEWLVMMVWVRMRPGESRWSGVGWGRSWWSGVDHGGS